MDAVRQCRACGCSQLSACMTAEGPCHWTEDDLCSACAPVDHADVAIEEDILDILSDEDGELLPSEALLTLLTVVAGICCLATSQRPEDLAAEFCAQLMRVVREERPVERLLS